MKLLHDIFLFFWRKTLEKLRNPIYLFMGVITPLVYLAFFSPLLKNLVGTNGFPEGNVLDIFVPGMLVMTTFFNGLFVGWGIIDELRSGVIERFRVTSSSRFALLAGPVVSDLVATLMQLLAFVLLALPFGFRIDPLGLIALLGLLSLLLATTASMMYTFGLITKSEDKLAPIVQGINLPILLLSGMLLPMSLAPKWLLIIAHFNPVYYVVEAARMLAVGQLTHSAVIQAFAVMIPLTCLVMSWSTRVFKKAVY